jgi:uncharacterized protein (DUF1800 family)
MFHEPKRVDASDPWVPYEPTAKAPWNLQRVVHLHRRAGFSATWDEIQRDLKDGPGASVDRLLAAKARMEGVANDFEHIANLLAEQAIESRDPVPLKGWWMYRMQAGPDPLGERLALLWHNHFATSNEKVNDVAAMKRQNDFFRQKGRGPFGELLKAVVHDPALLVWLDAPANRKDSPNENLGREIMELFTLGVGNYTEADVKEAGRALTGWKVAGGAFRNWEPDHDNGEKTILGKKGRWSGDDLVRLLLEHPATSRRLAWRLCEWLMGENSVDTMAVDALAGGLRRHELDIGWAIGTVLRSNVFFADKNRGNRVLGPVEFIIGSARALERFDPLPNNRILGEWASRLGQDLFYPPNVGGWSGGRDWLSTQTIIGRSNYAVALVEGKLSPEPVRVDTIALAKKHGRGRDLEDYLTFFMELLTGIPSSNDWLDRLLVSLGPKAKLSPDIARAALALIVASPQVQMA